MYVQIFNLFFSAFAVCFISFWHFLLRLQNGVVRISDGFGYTKLEVLGTRNHLKMALRQGWRRIFFNIRNLNPRYFQNPIRHYISGIYFYYLSNEISMFFYTYPTGTKISVLFLSPGEPYRNEPFVLCVLCRT